MTVITAFNDMLKNAKLFFVILAETEWF